ncbi:MAG: hypothetical protein HJJLKODD_02369 [Phycisphaerae bacterium]|nr:hypothetical protein [Phycisphaerae bacterium]
MWLWERVNEVIIGPGWGLLVGVLGVCCGMVAMRYLHRRAEHSLQLLPLRRTLSGRRD